MHWYIKFQKFLVGNHEILPHYKRLLYKKKLEKGKKENAKNKERCAKDKRHGNLPSDDMHWYIKFQKFLVGNHEILPLYKRLLYKKKLEKGKKENAKNKERCGKR